MSSSLKVKLWMNKRTLLLFAVLGIGSQEEAQKNGRASSWGSPSRQCSSTPVSFGRGFLSKEQSDISGTSPILSWPNCGWFLPLVSNKSALKGWRLSDDADIIKDVTEEQKSLSQNGFQECFQQLYSLWQKCIFAQWD